MRVKFQTRSWRDVKVLKAFQKSRIFVRFLAFFLIQAYIMGSKTRKIIKPRVSEIDKINVKSENMVR